MNEMDCKNRGKHIFAYPGRTIFPEKYDCHSLATLETALHFVPAYQEWRVFDPGSSYSIDERYAALPSLNKQHMRAYSPAMFVPTGRNLDDGLADGEVELVETSGSTDDRVTNIWCQTWWDASERASFKLNNDAVLAADGTHREAILTSPLCTGVLSDDGDLPMTERVLGRFLYLNEKLDPSTWGTRHLDRMIAELNTYAPAVLEANPSFLSRLARYISDYGKQVKPPKLIVLTYEFPSRIHYRQIKRAFGCPVVSSYGTTETGYIFMECEAGRFHQNCEFCRVDFQPLKEEHGGPLIGRILVTTFKNPWNIMVRFNVGDLVRLEQSANCPCGRREGLILKSIEGRFNHVTFSPTGRCVTKAEIDRRLSGVSGIAEYQLRQTAQNEYHLSIVEEKDASPRLENAAIEALNKAYGDQASISVHFVDALLLDSAPKYQLTKSQLEVDVNDLLDPRYVSII